MNPFSKTPSDSVSHLGESALIRRIGQWLGRSSPPYPAGMGDDCAVIPPSLKSNLITTDCVYYGIHFDDQVSGHDAGAKLLKRNISDIAAMGGIPLHAVIAMTLPANTSTRWIETFTQGIAKTAQAYDVLIVGGDITRTKQDLGASLTLCGYAEAPILRKTANSNDLLYVTGELGGSILKKHVAFEPRLKEGQFLSQSGLATACIDITDGLGKDLPSLIPEGCIALIDSLKVPISSDAKTHASKTKKSPLAHAFNDGEDYELLFSINPEDEEELLEKWPQVSTSLLTKIGQLQTCQEPLSESKIIDSQSNIPIKEIHGFQHLR